MSQKNIRVSSLFIIIIMFIGIIQPKPVNGEINKRKVRDVEKFESKLDDEVPDLIKKYKIPGTSIAIVHEGKVTNIKNYGLADKKNTKLINNSSVFQAGSISKSVTAWGIMHLVDEGKIKLDDPVEKYLTRWHLPLSKFNKNEVTIRRLLSHTAGLSLQGYSGISPEKKLPTIEESLSGGTNESGDVRIILKPGSEFKYSGGGYTVLQLLIEEVTKESFSKYMEEKILKPLGMNNSSYELSNKAVSNMIIPYGVLGQALPRYIYTEKAAAGLTTTTTDFSKFMLAGMDGINGEKRGRGVLKPETIDLMYIPIKHQYGLGFFKTKLKNSTEVIYHGGTNRGWRSNFAIVPDNKDGIVIFVNSNNGDNIINDVMNYWEEYETGYLSQGYYQLKNMRNYVKIINYILLFGFVIYAALFVYKLKNGKRIFWSKINNKLTVKFFIRIIIPMLCISLWWLFFYAGVFTHGWDAAEFMPFGFEKNTYIITLWGIVFALGGLFPKIKSVKYPELN